MKFVSFSYLGGTVGSVITFPLCGESIAFLSLSFFPIKCEHSCPPCHSSLLFISGIIIHNMSWVWVFYSTAALTILWSLLWFTFMFDFPEDDPYISGELSFRLHHHSQMPRRA